LDQREMWAFCNDAAVREAIHARPISDIGAFDECTNLDRIFYERQNPTVVAVHMELVSRGVKALVYSGDHDAVISNVGTERWIKDARLPRTHAWEAWHTPDGQVAGFCEHYEGLTYATVRGAGHAVPELKPEQALLMIQRFMKSEGGLVRDTVAAV
ncbi:serine carboxypeptidase, partial [Helicosporidium sp. ATCC 50920]